MSWIHCALLSITALNKIHKFCSTMQTLFPDFTTIQLHFFPFFSQARGQGDDPRCRKIEKILHICNNHKYIVEHQNTAKKEKRRNSHVVKLGSKSCRTRVLLKYPFSVRFQWQCGNIFSIFSQARTRRDPRCLVNNSQPVSVQVYVEVLDVNDNTPLTEVPVYYPSVLENSPAGVSVLQIRAFDRDVSPQQFTFSITSGNPEGYFLINSTTGKFHMVSREKSRYLARESK